MQNLHDDHFKQQGGCADDIIIGILILAIIFLIIF